MCANDGIIFLTQEANASWLYGGIWVREEKQDSPEFYQKDEESHVSAGNYTYSEDQEEQG